MEQSDAAVSFKSTDFPTRRGPLSTMSLSSTGLSATSSVVGAVAEVERRTGGENRVGPPPREAIAPGYRRTPPGIAIRQSREVIVSHDLSVRNPPGSGTGASGRKL